MRPVTEPVRDQSPRIAAVGAARALVPALGELPGQPTVREFDELFANATDLTEFGPALVCLGHDESFEQDLGGIRMLRALLPDLAIVLVAEERTPSLRATCVRHDVHLLDPCRSTEELTRILAGTLQDGPDARSYLQFVQGICDEINNPLMFASGHLQLLATRLDQQSDRDLIAPVEAAQDGLGRIQRTMRKVAAMGRATREQRQDTPFTVATLCEHAESQLRATAARGVVTAPEEIADLTIHGDLDLLTSALVGLAEVGRELAPGGDPMPIEVEQHPAGVEVRMRIEHPRLEDWELPRLFEPYHLNDILRGTTLGLNLFLVKLVARAHGWDATACRLPEGAVEFCISPAAVRD